MEIIIFQLLSCLYFYDSGVVSQQTPGSCREVCAKSVDRLPASKGLK